MTYESDARPRCQERVYDAAIWSSGRRPCGKPAKHDPDASGTPTRCGIHSAAAKAKRKARIEQADAARSREQERNRIKAEAPGIVRMIAAGHDDPQGLCKDWIKRLEELE